MQRESFRIAMQRSAIVVIAVSTLVFCGGCAELQGIDLGRILAANGPPDRATVANGLKEALEVGTRRATASLSKPGGFSADPRFRLRIPGQLGTLADAMRRIGFGSELDALEDSMNLAAEEAAARAVPVFADAIRKMTIADALVILSGPEDAATAYFKQQTSAALRARFEPVVEGAMREVGVYAVYRDLKMRYDRIPFAKPAVVDLEAHVTQAALDALFSKLAEEEARIRKDPAARSTALLRRVFGVASGPAI